MKTLLNKTNHIIRQLNKQHVKQLEVIHAHDVEEYERGNRAEKIQALETKYYQVEDKINTYIEKISPLLSKLIANYDEQLDSYRWQKNQAISDCNIGVTNPRQKLKAKFAINKAVLAVKSAKQQLERIMFTLNYKGLKTRLDEVEYIEPEYCYMLGDK